MEQKTAPAKKVKFAPKAPQRRVPKPVVKSEVKEETESAEAKELLCRFNESSLLGKPKLEKKVGPSQAFRGAPNSVNSYDKYKISGSDGGGVYPSHLKEMKEYKEPWDYYCYYPVTLPLRRPYSGDPALLDDEEFQEASQNMRLDEGSNLENDLSLEAENQKTCMFFLQLPATMPMENQSANTGHRKKACTLNELPAGYVGKMLVFKSGVIKLKIGDSLFNVSSGSDCGFAQDVVAVNSEEKLCCIVGELNKRAVVTPDVDSILSGMTDAR